LLTAIYRAPVLPRNLCTFRDQLIALFAIANTAAAGPAARAGPKRLARTRRYLGRIQRLTQGVQVDSRIEEARKAAGLTVTLTVADTRERKW